MDFLFAVARNDVEKVRHMLQTGIDVNSSILWNSKDTYSPVIPINTRSDSLQTDQEYQCKPLNIAVLGGHPNMVRLLLSAGADINNKDGRGRTALVCAIYGLDLDASNINTSNLHLISQTNSSHFDIMKNILLCHPNLYYATLDSPQYEIKGITPLCLASYLGKSDIIQLLLDDGRVNVDGTDSKNATALMYAARDGNVPIVKMLLGYHASPDITDSHGWSAIQYAERNPEIVQLCEQVLRVKRSELSVTSGNNTQVNYPINYAKLSHLLTTIPNYPSSLSHLQFDTLKEIDHLDPSAAPLVHIIQSAFLQAIKIHDHLSLQTLLMKSPPINPQQEERYGPLLINHHDPKTGLTAFHHAMRTKPLPSLDTITMLFQAGADMNAQTYYGRTALHHLARFGLDKEGKAWGIQKSNNNQQQHQHQQQQQQQQQQHTGDINYINNIHVPQHLAMCASLLIRFGSLVNIADPTGNTPLHFASEFGGVFEVLEVLILEGGADLGLKNKKGFTPLDVCKSDDIRKKMIALDNERKQVNNLKTKSAISSLSGTIRPFDSASEYNRCSTIISTPTQPKVSRSIPPSFSFMFGENFTNKQLLLQQQKQLNDTGDKSTTTNDFQVILKAFFNYQTTFTDSIESSLAYITDSILSSWQTSSIQQQQLESTIGQLRFDLREAHEMFDTTDQLVEKVMMSFRDELESVEQIHQADWELSELQHDKIEKLFDVFERIDGRFCQIELSQDDLIHQVEKLRKYAIRRQQLPENDSIDELKNCIIHVVQSLSILQSISSIDNHHLKDDRNRLFHDMNSVINQLLEKLKGIDSLTDAKEMVEKKWINVKDILTKDIISTNSSQTTLVRSISQPTTLRQKSKLLLNNNGEPSLNQLELSFDILHSNLYEIEKDIEEVTDHLEKLMISKKKMYETCLELEKELNVSSKRTEQQIKSELQGVLLFTRQILDKQQALEKERQSLLKEYNEIGNQLDTTQNELKLVRPPLLLQGLLERLETDESNSCVRIEKDWKEDPNLVSEVIMDNTSSSSSCSEEEEENLTAIQLNQLNSTCSTKLSNYCYISLLDASLYCLKVLASHLINQSRQNLLQVQTSLGQASNDLDETRNNMTQLYDDAAEVARQVFALKTELETIVRHRKEEVVKVWEVVDEVSEGVDIRNSSGHSQSQSQPQQQQQKQRIEEQDRHQWIIRELEQLYHVHQSLQDVIDDLKQQQSKIGQNLRQLASDYIEPQVDKLVGQNDDSLLSTSDKLAELMDRIRENDVGLRPNWSLLLSTHVIEETSHRKPSTATNRLSSVATNRLSIATTFSTRSSKRMSTAISIRTTEKKRMSIISATSLSSLSSYQQERMMAKASSLSNALLKVKK